MGNSAKAVFLLSALYVASSHASMHPVKPFAQQYISDSINWMTEQNIACDLAEQSHPMCDSVTVYFNDGNYDPQRTKSQQTILVLDYGMDLQTVLRYRSRVIATYKYDHQSQSFVADNPSVTISKLGKKLLTELDGFTYLNGETGYTESGFLPAAWLGELAAKYVSIAKHDKYDHITGKPHFSHGTKVFGYLAQHNPDAEFVIVDTESFSPFINHKDAFCSRDIEALHSKMQRAANSLRADVIEQHGVEYINYSGGFERTDVRNAWSSSSCNGQLSNSTATEFVKSIKPIYDVLFNTHGVLGLHAGAIGASSSENPLDVTEYPNRVRVMSYTTGPVDTNITATGDLNWQQVFVDHTSEFSGDKYIDLFVNFGYGRSDFWEQNSTPKMASDVYGMRYGADWEFPSSSWATPIATSYAIATQTQLELDRQITWFDPALLKQTLLPNQCFDNGGYFINFKLSQFIRDGEGVCRIQDPLKHRIDELNRQQYLN